MTSLTTGARDNKLGCMTEKQNRLDVLDSMPVNRAIWTLALPTIAAMLVQVIYNMADTFFIGKLNNPDMVAAVSIAFPIFMILQAFGNVFAIGGASLISRLLGKGLTGDASRAGSISFWSALAVCTGVAVAGLVFVEPILAFCGASTDTMGFAKSYMVIILLGSPLIGMQMALSGLLRSEGATREAMVGMMAGSILNIILDPIFILWLGMGVAGAAVATVIGNMVGFGYYMAFYLCKRGVISLSPRLFRLEAAVYKEILKIGIPASIGMILMGIGFAWANVFAAGFGDDVVAANGVVMRVTGVAVMLTMGLAFGCQPLMGYSYGARKYDRLTATIKRAMVIGTVICTGFAVLYFVFADLWIMAFINDAGVIGLGAVILRAHALAIPMLGVEMILVVMFQSLGKAMESLVLSVGRQGLFFVPALYALSLTWGFHGFIFALPAADVATTLLAVALFLLMRKEFAVPARSAADTAAG